MARWSECTSAACLRADRTKTWAVILLSCGDNPPDGGLTCRNRNSVASWPPSIPSTKSQKLQVRRVAELSSGLGVTMPIFIERAGGGILVDVDGNHIIDFASGIAVTSVGASDPAVVRRIEEQAERFTHTCFLVTGVQRDSSM